MAKVHIVFYGILVGIVSITLLQWDFQSNFYMSRLFMHSLQLNLLILNTFSTTEFQGYSRCCRVVQKFLQVSHVLHITATNIKVPSHWHGVF
jgi:hypothetical protein